MDDRNIDSDIYAQRYSKEGITMEKNFKINDDQVSAWQTRPSLSIDGEGNYVIAWEDNRFRDVDIYAQRYSYDGTALRTNFKVSDDQGSATQSFPSVSTDASGNFVITWWDERNGYGNWDIYAQRYSSDGTALGTNFRVNDDQGDTEQDFPSISIDSSGNFVIVWEDHRNENFDIYAQRYSYDGTALGSNFIVNDDEGSAYQINPSISTDRSGNFVIIWGDGRIDGGIYAQRSQVMEPH